MELVFTFNPSAVTSSPPACTDHDAALIAEARAKLEGREAELDAARWKLAAACAQAAREDHLHGVSGDHVAAIKALVVTITRLEGEVLFYETTLVGLEAAAPTVA